MKHSMLVHWISLGLCAFAAACSGSVDAVPPGDGDAAGDGDGDGGDGDAGDGDTGDGDGNSGTLADALDGRSFELESSEGYTPVQGTTITLSFADGNLGFHAGCNGHSAEVSFDANVLVVGGFGSTLIGCEAALQDQDSWLSDFFSSSPTVTIDWDRVTFSSGDVTLVFLDDEVANPAPPLIGTTWEVTTFIDGDIAFGGAFENPPTVTFQSDGRVVVFTGCNSGSGNYEYDNSSINFSDIGYTEAACTDMADVEQHLQMVFTQGEVSYRFDSLQLVIDRGTLGIRATEFE